MTLSRLGSIAAFVVFLLTGIFFQHAAIIRDGFARIHGNLGDARLVNLFLEHNYLYFFSAWPPSLWDVPWMFFPFANGLAMSEVMTGNLAVYAPLRLCGLDPIRAYQGWFLMTSLLNFVCLLCFLRRLGLPSMSSLIGAFVFAFAQNRAGFMGHPQLLPNFPWALCCIFFLNYTRSFTNRARCINILAASLALGFQFWCGVYLGWFFCLGVLIMCLASVVYAPSRRIVWMRMHQDSKVLAAAAVTMLIVLLPLLYHYGLMKRVVGARSFGEVESLLPPASALLLATDGSYLYQFLFLNFFPIHPVFSEMFQFPGFVALLSPLIVSLLLYFDRSWLKAQPHWRSTATLVAVTVLIVMALPIQINGHSLWRFVYGAIPGAKAIRAVGRITLLALLGQAICVAFLAEYLRTRTHGWRSFTMVSALGILVIAENAGDFRYSFAVSEHKARIDSIGSRFDEAIASGRNCRVFYSRVTTVQWMDHVDAMWFSQASQVPTINGYSGSTPPGYGELGLVDSPQADLDDVLDWLKEEGSNLSSSEVCVI